MTTTPLNGIRVLDMSRLLPGPLATLFLADLGAEVIKVENPRQPDYVRHFPPFYQKEQNHCYSANYLSLNRSKKNLAIDYTQPEGRELLYKLIETADILIEQFRPGFLKQFGLDYDSLKGINPGLIYVSITGYGQNGPYAHKAGHDLNYAALAGVLALNGGDQKPQPLPVQIADVAGGSYMAVIGTLAALVARHTTGKGDHIDVSMSQGVLPMLNLLLANLWASQQNTPKSELPLSGGLINYDTYMCRDGRWIAFAALEPKFWMRFCEVVQRPDLLAAGLEQQTNPEKKEAFRQELRLLFAQKSQAEWLALDAAHDLLISPVYELHELETDPHWQQRNAFVQVPHPILGSYKSVALPLRFGQYHLASTTAAPELGEHSLQLLQELGIDEHTLQQLQKKGILALA